MNTLNSKPRYKRIRGDQNNPDVFIVEEGKVSDPTKGTRANEQYLFHGL